MANTTRILTYASHLRIEGTFEGIDFGVNLNPVDGTLLWTARYASLPAVAETDPKSQEKECNNCGRTGVKKLIEGGWSWAKAALGVDRRSEEEARANHSICLNCPSRCFDLGICRDDWPDRQKDQQGCGCIVALKVLDEKERCPHKHW